MYARGIARLVACIVMLAAFPSMAEPQASKLAPIFIRSLDLVNATVLECVDSIRDATGKSDPDGEPVNIVVKLPPAVAGKKVTLRFGSVPLDRAIGQLCELAGAQYRLERVAYVISDHLPDHSAFDEEIAKRQGTDAAKQLENIILPSSLPVDGRTLLDAVAWVTAQSMDLDPDGEGLYFALADVDRNGAEVVCPLSLRNVRLLDFVRYLAYVSGLEIELTQTQVLLRPKRNKTKAGSNTH
ncbi:MAG: hypothetical protein HN742_02040 [Lentisphaerae bacterium]|nr:hypothetical protein [Lentisphaerota bacterium]MBT4816806.1 hypothetical protein [Lentisphaerota bacterium]MBT5611259.1 hypothetical protein [Lentisphaerota bacterium]MBT7059198.1 hypothetical protein [Lentisphaerota bacterium]MBT7840618.1 hypothetical protein [Lentisphaerota bacterium]